MLLLRVFAMKLLFVCKYITMHHDYAIRTSLEIKCCSVSFLISMTILILTQLLIGSKSFFGNKFDMLNDVALSYLCFLSHQVTIMFLTN